MMLAEWRFFSETRPRGKFAQRYMWAVRRGSGFHTPLTEPRRGLEEQVVVVMAVMGWWDLCAGSAPGSSIKLHLLKVIFSESSESIVENAFKLLRSKLSIIYSKKKQRQRWTVNGWVSMELQDVDWPVLFLEKHSGSELFLLPGGV